MGLMDLSQELRDYTFSFILIKPQNTITMLSNAHCFQSEVSASQPALSKVSKQLRAEALPIFYNSNVFLAEISDAEDLETAKNWLAAIGDENVRHLRHLVMSGWTKPEQSGNGRQGFQYQYIRLMFDLREGKVGAGIQSEAAPPGAERYVEEMESSFRRAVDLKVGERWTADELGGLMERFNAICTSAC